MFEDIPAILPLHFFDISYRVAYLSSKKDEIRKKKYLLPSTSKYLSEKERGEFYLGWNEKGISICAEIKAEEVELSFPEYRRGDCLELFFDTRNIKSSGYVTKFCHHFVVFPLPIDGHYIKEVTRFRNEDMHILASAEDFKISVKISKVSYLIDLFIPSKCLYGFDSTRFDKLGFTYRINVKNEEPSHFSLSSKELSIERNPFFWSTLTLVKN